MYTFLVLFDLKNASSRRYKDIYRTLDGLGRRQIRQQSCHVLVTDYLQAEIEHALSLVLHKDDLLEVIRLYPLH